MQMEDTLENKIVKMTANSPCDCKSGKTWKQCCGQHLENPEGYTANVRVAPGTAVRWFLGNMAQNDIHRDELGRPVVFTSRAQAIGLAEKIGTVQILGMSESKWALFQKDFPNHVVISDAVA